MFKNLVFCIIVFCVPACSHESAHQPRFERSQQLAVGGVSESSNVVLGDLDSDGDLDAWTTVDGAFQVWLNQGVGEFIPGQRIQFGSGIGEFFIESSNRRPTALGDVDSDGGNRSQGRKKGRRGILRKGSADSLD